MRTIKWTLSIGLAGCYCSGSFEVADDTTEDEIDEIAKDEVFGCIDWNWWEEENAKIDRT